MVSDMTPERASKIVTHVAAQRLRWGKHYQAEDEGINNLMDALVVMAHAQNITHDSEVKELRDQITKLNRQLAAANARAKKFAKRGGLGEAAADIEENFHTGEVDE